MFPSFEGWVILFKTKAQTMPDYFCTRFVSKLPKPTFGTLRMKRNILLITTDQMRYDALGCNGGKVAKTPTIDGLSSDGINYKRAHNQNVVCMPARATIITGQHVGSHGVWMNGVSMPEDRDSIALHLQRHGYATGLL